MTPCQVAPSNALESHIPHCLPITLLRTRDHTALVVLLVIRFWLIPPDSQSQKCGYWCGNCAKEPASESMDKELHILANNRFVGLNLDTL